MPVPTIEDIEEYLESLEELVFSTLSISEVPSLREAVNRLWLDISRYGPNIPTLPQGLPSLGDFQLPPPPPPPPPPPVPRSLLSQSLTWAENHPWKASTIATGVVGAGLLVYYGAAYRRVSHSRRRLKAASSERREVVVVLGGDTPLGLPLIKELESKGYIVIVSVATAGAVDDIESQSSGFVRALVLDPYESNTIPVFLRSLTSTLSRRFPITASGDLYAPASSLPHVCSVVSLLSLLTPGFSAPFERISLQSEYISYLNATHITPLQVTQSLLPILRTGAARSQDKGRKAIIFCLPVTAARVGLPFASMQAMSSAATLRAIEVLRREINVAALSDKTETMKNINVTAVDVGAFHLGDSSPSLPPHDVYKAMEGWSATEKMVYGPAFASILHEVPAQPRTHWSAFSSLLHNQVPIQLRRPGADVETFVSVIATIISDGKLGIHAFGFGPWLRRSYNRLARKRVTVGAGALTYKIASHLPTTILDALLMIPHLLISVRNSLLPTQPHVLPSHHPLPNVYPVEPASVNDDIEAEDSLDESSDEPSDADIESSGGTTSESWISLDSSSAR